jgi:hypothetical protein
MSDTFSNKETEAYWISLTEENKQLMLVYRKDAERLSKKYVVDNMFRDFYGQLDSVKYFDGSFKKLIKNLLADAAFEIDFDEVYDKIMEVSKNE